MAAASGNPYTSYSLASYNGIAIERVNSIYLRDTGTKLNDRKLTDLRLHKIGFIFQTFNLVNVLDVHQNVEFPLLLQGNLSNTERKRRVDELVERVGLKDQVHQRSNELSGGQRSRARS